MYKLKQEIVIQCKDTDEVRMKEGICEVLERKLGPFSWQESVNYELADSNCWQLR